MTDTVAPASPAAAVRTKASWRLPEVAVSTTRVHPAGVEIDVVPGALEATNSTSWSPGATPAGTATVWVALVWLPVLDDVPTTVGRSR